MKRFKLYTPYGLKVVDEYGDVYTDGKYIYKYFDKRDLYKFKKALDRAVLSTYKNSVNILGYEVKGELVIVKMENLMKVTPKLLMVSESLYNQFDKDLMSLNYDVSKLPKLLNKYTDERLVSIIDSYMKSAKELGKSRLDMHIDNIMYDPKTYQFKHIDYL